MAPERHFLSVPANRSTILPLHTRHVVGRPRGHTPYGEPGMLGGGAYGRPSGGRGPGEPTCPKSPAATVSGRSESGPLQLKRMHVPEHRILRTRRGTSTLS